MYPRLLIHVVNNVVLANPNIDASDKQVLMRNDFITDENKLKKILESDKAREQITFKPSEPGSLNLRPKITK